MEKEGIFSVLSSIFSALSSIFGAKSQSKEVKQAIQTKYEQLSSQLGANVSTDVIEVNAGIWKQTYTNGAIYYAKNSGACAVYGSIYKKYVSMGEEKSLLGLPITDETGTPDRIGRFNHFQGGSIYWMPALGANAVSKVIRDEWERRGWERGILGYPISDTTSVQLNTFKNEFQGGSISWSQSTGYTVVPTQKNSAPSISGHREILAPHSSNSTFGNSTHSNVGQTPNEKGSSSTIGSRASGVTLGNAGKTQKEKEDNLSQAKLGMRANAMTRKL